MVTRFLPASASAIVLLTMMLATHIRSLTLWLGLACVVLSFSVAAVLKRKDQRAHASVAAGAFAVVAAGQGQATALFGILAGSFLLAALYAMREARRNESVATAIPMKPIAVTLAFTAILVALCIVFLPPIAAKVEQTVTSMMGVDGEEATAFSTTMALGSTTGMLQSSAIVARIEGSEPTYLRGAVYDRYDGRYWINSFGRELKTVKATTGTRPTATITLDRHAPTGADMRWFLPPNACHFPIDVDVDAFGVVHRGNGPVPAKLDYTQGRCTDAEELTPIAPTAQDLEVPSYLRKYVVPAATKAAGDKATDEAKLQAILNSFAGYEYSLAVKRNERLDPVADFLTEHQAGHCEMFASAMVLEARAHGIPARVVGGYHVSEVDQSGTHWVVRDRNAHAWVEAWDGRHWKAWDPTPLSDAPQARPGRWQRFWDRIGDLWALAWDAAANLGPLEIAVLLMILVVILVAIRQVGLWLRRPRRRRMAVALERPLPCFEKLTTALAAKGFVRDPSEPLEAFAARLPLAEAAAAVGVYAAFRYGDVGVEKDVVAAVEAAVAKAR